MDTPAEYARAAEVYAAIFELEPAERAARLAEICGADRDLRRWVEELLDADEALRASEKEGSGATDLFGRGAGAALDEERSGPRRLAAGSIAAGRYRLLAAIGTGGAGEVFSAEDLLLQQTVALKFLRRRAHVKARAAELLNEVRMARRVRHPNVCQIFDVGEAEGERFISMEYVRGPNLAEELRRIGALARPKALQVAHQLCAGLSAIHRQGIVHGDLKPANVMLDERGDVRILDFGISEARKEAAPDTAGPAPAKPLIGTPAYLAPERWQGSGVTVEADIYALGLILYEVFSGVRPIVAENALAYRHRHETTVAPPLSTHVADVDGAVESIIERCLAKSPAERPASAIEVARALPGGDALGGLVLAGVLPTPERVAEGGAERPWSPPAIAALSLLLLVLLGTAALLMPRGYLVEGSHLPIAPVALADRAATILRELGYVDLPHTAFGFGVFNGEAQILFWYRGSPAPLEANVLESSIELVDPPFTEAGMVGVVLAPTGELRAFLSIGPDPPPAVGEGEMLRLLFHFAGLERGKFDEIAPTSGRFLHRGRAQAWTQISGGPGWHVEASDEGGRVVYFEVVEPGHAPLWGNGQPRTAFRRAVGPFVFLFGLAALLVAAGLAWRNLRRGVVDRLGARRTALAVLLLALAHGLTDVINTGTATLHLRYLVFALEGAALYASMTWIFYAALEPHFRRYWPQGLVTWTRLVRGRFGDPVLGRDLVLGACLGIAAVIFEALEAWLGQGDGASSSLLPTLEQLRSITGPWGALGAVLAAALGAIVLAWIQLSLLVLLRRFIGPGVMLILAFAVVLTAGNALFEPKAWTALTLPLIFWLVAGAVFVRFGFAALVSASFFFLALTHLPTTLDPTQWYFPTSVAGFALLLGLVGLASFTAARRREAADDGFAR
jgi:hypothetical protein